jgi:hypothetical protein
MLETIEMELHAADCASPTCESQPMRKIDFRIADIRRPSRTPNWIHRQCPRPLARGQTLNHRRGISHVLVKNGGASVAAPVAGVGEYARPWS